MSRDLESGFGGAGFEFHLEPEKVGVTLNDRDEIRVVTNAMELFFQPLKIDQFDFSGLIQVHAALVKECSIENNLPRSAESMEVLRHEGRIYEVHYAPARELEYDCAADLADAVKNFRQAVADKDRLEAVEGLVDVHQVLLNAHYLRDHNAVSAAMFVRKLALSEGINLTLPTQENFDAMRGAAVEAVPDVYEIIGKDRYEAECSTDTLYEVYLKQIGKRWEEKPELTPEAKEIARQCADQWYPEHSLKDVVTIACQSIDDPGVRRVAVEKEILRALMADVNKGLTLPPYKLTALLEPKSKWLLGTEAENFREKHLAAAEARASDSVRYDRRKMSL